MSELSGSIWDHRATTARHWMRKCRVGDGVGEFECH